MRNESVKFCLVVVTPSGWHHALNSAPPTQSSRFLHDLEDVMHKIMPGHGTTYLTHIARCDCNSNPIEQEMQVIDRYTRSLAKRLYQPGRAF